MSKIKSYYWEDISALPEQALPEDHEYEKWADEQDKEDIECQELEELSV